MKYSIYIALCASFIFTGCGSEQPDVPIQNKPSYEKPTAAKETRFHTAMGKVAHSTVDNEHYNKMSLDTAEKKEWFKHLMYLLWDRQITRKAFIAEGLTKYPNHRYEFTYIANAFQRF